MPETAFSIKALGAVTPQPLMAAEGRHLEKFVAGSCILPTPELRSENNILLDVEVPVDSELRPPGGKIFLLEQIGGPVYTGLKADALMR